jgi:ArsR family transcriptional regulator
MDARLRSVDRLFKAVADPTRVRILGLLLGGELCVCHIHENLGIPQPKTSRHLAYLRRAGLVEARKRGLWVYYRLATRSDGLGQTLLDAIHHCIGHLATIKRDRARLARKTGCAVVAAAAPHFRCCAEVGVVEESAERP